MSSHELADNFRQTNYSEIYFKSILALKNIETLLMLSRTSILTFGTVFVFIGIIVIIINILHLISECKKDFRPSENDNDSTNFWTFTNDQIFKDNRKALKELHEAIDKCYKKHYVLKCIELLIYRPHLINQCLPNSKGITAFHRACYRGYYCLIEFMIDKGADLSQKTDSGVTAFHMVIDYYIRNSTQRKFSCLDLLYQKGCYLKKNSEWYKKFVSDARKAKNEDLVQWLVSHSTPMEKIVWEMKMTRKG